MPHPRALAVILSTLAAVTVLGRSPEQPPAGAQQDQITTTITAVGGPARMAVPEFIPLTNDPETVKAAKTIGQVLYDDIAFEKEFYMIPRDILRTIPQPASADGVALHRWKEVGADGLIVGTVRRSGDGIVVEVRLIQVATGVMALGKQYSGTVRSVADGGRIFAHTFADQFHENQRGLRGIARTKLAFSSDRDGGRMQGPVAARDISNIYTSDYDGFNPTRRTATRSLDITPVLSPDGRYVAYTTYRYGFQEIIVQSLTEIKPLLRPAGGSFDRQNYLPAWSPDGSKIAFTTNRDGNHEIYTVNRDGSDLRRLTNHPMVDVTPTWSPTGTQIAFTSDRTGSPQIYIVNADGTSPQRISGESHCDRPTWSPAPFNEIAYTCRGGGGYQIMLFNFATRTSTPITDGIGSNESPAFAPNGRHISFVSDRTGRQQIYTIHRDGTGLRQITREGTNKYPHWSQ